LQIKGIKYNIYPYISLLKNMKTLLIGLIAGMICTFSFMPQAIKMYRTKNARDVSLTAFITLGVGVLFWLVYGLMLMELPIILANAVTFFLVAVIIAMKIKYK
jgi:MtN3 and saliva related transmembrane protein